MKLKANKVKSGKGEESNDSETTTATAPENVRNVPLELVASHDELPNRPLKKEHVASLKDSIRKHGLDVPLIVWNGGDDDVMMEVEGVKGEHPATFLVAGAHRREALRQLSKEDSSWFKKTFPDGIPVMVQSGDLKSALAAQLRENLDRDNPDAAEVLPQVKRLQEEFKMKGSEIARAIGKSKSWVSTVLDIEKQLGEETLESVQKGEIGLTDALEAAKEVKTAKKSGKKVSVKKVVAKVKAKAATKKNLQKSLGLNFTSLRYATFYRFFEYTEL